MIPFPLVHVLFLRSEEGMHFPQKIQLSKHQSSSIYMLYLWINSSMSLSWSTGKGHQHHDLLCTKIRLPEQSISSQGVWLSWSLAVHLTAVINYTLRNSLCMPLLWVFGWSSSNTFFCWYLTIKYSLAEISSIRFVNFLLRVILTNYITKGRWKKNEVTLTVSPNCGSSQTGFHLWMSFCFLT